MDFLDDPLDSDDFDPVQYINQRFPTEASLDDLDGFIDNIGNQITSLDDEISHAVQAQSAHGREATRDLKEAQTLVEELFSKIVDIKSKASQSESMVQDLCSDIKKLDCAKNHLQTSITSLNRLQMLISAVDQLEILSKEYQFREAANLLDAVKQFISHFEKYKHVPIIIDLNKRIDNIRDELTKVIKDMFRELAEKIDTVADADLILTCVPGGKQALIDACLVVDALDTNIRRSLLEDFVQKQLISYDNLFGHDQAHFSLDQVERRWPWFLRLLTKMDSKVGHIFPKHWRLELRLCLEFIERSKMHLILLLSELEGSESIELNPILIALKSTKTFEQDMTKRFNLLTELKLTQDLEVADSKSKKQEAEIEKRLKRESKIMYIPTDHDAINKEDESESGFLTLANSAISGGISGVFDKFLGCYVMNERQNLVEMLAKLNSEEDIANNSNNEGGSSTSHTGNVLGSSTNMFVFIKKSIARCITLSNGHTLLSLSEEFRESMHKYITMLKGRCPPEIGQSPPIFKLPPGSEINISYMINTAEYCAEVVPQLEKMIQQKIVPNLAPKIDFTEEADAFMDLLAHCLRVLVFGILDRLDSSFKEMAAINWSTFEQVGEESKYLHAFQHILREAIPNIRIAISSSYFSNFCTKLATEILSKYLEAITKQKKITEPASQQLLLDTYNIKTLLLQLPNLGLDSNDFKPISSVYTKLINSKISHIEMILKLVGTPEEMLLERFRIMWPEGQSADLQMLMALKGTKRNDQQVILEMLGLSAAGKMINKTATMIANASSTTSSSFASTSAASAAAFSSMKNLTHDISSSARNAVGNLKWTSKNMN